MRDTIVMSTPFFFRGCLVIAFSHFIQRTCLEKRGKTIELFFALSSLTVLNLKRVTS